MRTFLAALVLGVAAVLFTAGESSWRAMPRQVQLETHRLRMSIRGQGGPTVVFDGFGPGNLEMWGRVQREVSEFTTCVSFDHGSHWGSDRGPVPRDARQLARELHEALRRTAVPQPCLLVGYSMGGIYARVLASEFPEGVAGLILVDPTQEGFMDWFGHRFPEWNRVSPRHIEAQDELGCLADSLDQARRATLPPVPITLITGMKAHDVLSRALLPRWLAEHREWLGRYPGSVHVVTTNSGHDVLFNEPTLVVDRIRRMTLAYREAVRSSRSEDAVRLPVPSATGP